MINRMVVAGFIPAFALVFSVAGQAQQLHDASQREWSRIDHEGAGFKEGFTVDGERHGFWLSELGNGSSFRTYYVRGTDIDNALRIKVHDTLTLLDFMQEAEAGVNELVFDCGRATYLHAATATSSLEFMRALLDLGADPNQEGWMNGRTGEANL